MNPLLQLQDDVYGLLMSAVELRQVNIIQWRRLRVDPAVEWNTVWQVPRVDRSGAGIVIWMPQLRTEHQNLPGGERVTLGVTVVEEPNLNSAPETGTLLSAEDLALRVKDLLHAHCFWGLAEMVSSAQAITEDNDFPELLAYRCNFEMVLARGTTPRCDAPTASGGGSVLNLSNGPHTPNADIYYTLDGSYPCHPDHARGAGGHNVINPASQLYANGIIIPSGASLTVRAVAYQFGFHPSFPSQFNVTNNP